MLLDDLHLKKEQIKQLANQYGATNIRIFGSVARREERPDSDIDFLVEFPKGYDLFAQRFSLATKLEELTGRKIDIIPEHEMNKNMKKYILSEVKNL